MTGTILNAVTAAVMAVWPFFVLYAVTNGLMTLLLAGTACVLGVRLALAFAGRGETARSGRLLSAAGLVLVGLAALPVPPVLPGLVVPDLRFLPFRLFHPYLLFHP